MGNRFDERYDIRIANENDIERIMAFIDTHWKKGHILAIDRPFFEYEFLEEDGTVNFIIAVDKKKGTIECVNGFLKASHDQDCLDIWGSIWKVLDGNAGMLGIEIIRRRPKLTKCRCDLGVGNNPNTSVPIFRNLMRRYTAKMKHYYMLSDREDYVIAKIKRKKEIVINSNVSCNVYQVYSTDQLEEKFDVYRFKDTIPYKDYWYIEHRFFKHPIYEYNVYGVEYEGITEAIFVTRNQFLNNRYAIRMVDYIGNQDVFSGIGFFLQSLLENEGCEYIDFYCDGFQQQSIINAGFSELDENDENIIPNYFSPFIQENIEIWVDSARDNSLFTKADSDQDRPNSR